MSVGFSTIRPMDPATVSRAPSFTTTNNAPAASSPIDNGSAPKKKSHWFLKTIAAVVVVAAALGLGRKYLPTVFDSAATIASDAKWYQKAIGYTKKYLGVAGDFVINCTGKVVDYAKQGWEFIANKFKGGATTPPATTP